MHGEDFVVDDCADGQEIKHVRELLPDLGRAVFTLALCVKAINLGDLPGLVVAPQQADSLRKSDLEKQEEGNSLDTVLASVHVVAEEQVVDVGDIAAYLEELHDVPELPMNVTN